ncbi:NACHT domain-containing protein [Streptomyces sp. NPDC097617]|uniref:NACHT domain-containing protein n=1 Tax=Streptomyces sp. NPDC097617 TaxID=3366091 RepID=UPI00381AF1F3
MEPVAHHLNDGEQHKGRYGPQHDIGQVRHVPHHRGAVGGAARGCYRSVSIGVTSGSRDDVRAKGERLPLPEEFLRASGVPLSAPAGWVEDLMLSGRALVLVDGVDEVPQRLRTRTQTWLRSLVSAFPKARYVVTTRPSAVPEDWLTGQGFAPHSMLPMEQQDIRAFVAHWHAAARAEGQEVDAYEASLLEAVTSRRDLARLATNPLMCALLCALNQDRRMQLPRARKELYDAALDMLLVRRDTERDICGVEGVHLTREEQIGLLQRLAYWLIRNGQLETSRAEAVEMVGEWLDAMPQVRVQGGAEQVFTHLLIRSGLLLEPTPGSVVFVHRTFQDYLGAKAAVESRDFGVLVKNAQDDSWDDVVRMAVGHARTNAPACCAACSAGRTGSRAPATGSSSWRRPAWNTPPSWTGGSPRR